MRQWIRPHLSYANVVATMALFVALGGGTALAASYVISSNKQIGPGTISGHKPPSGDHANIVPGSINGKDIADRSGVETCQKPLVKKFGSICAGSPGDAKTWQAAVDYCAALGLRLPSLSEAITLAVKFGAPGISGADLFWTDDESYNTANPVASAVSAGGVRFFVDETSPEKTVCVTNPSA